MKITGIIKFEKTCFLKIINPTTNLLYGFYPWKQELIEIDCTKKEIVDKIQFKDILSNSSLAINSITNRLYIKKHPSFGGPLFSTYVIDLASKKIVGELPDKLESFVINEKNNLIWAIKKMKREPHVLYCIDGSTNEIVSTTVLNKDKLLIKKNPIDLALNPKTNMLYVVNKNDIISVINGESKQMIEEIQPHKGSYDSIKKIWINPSSNTLYMQIPISDEANTTDVLEIWSLDNKKTIKTLDMGDHPYIIHPTKDVIYTCKRISDKIDLLKIDSITGKTLDSLEIRDALGWKGFKESAKSLVLNPNTDEIYLSDDSLKQIHVIAG
jgi:hypothetical protein